MIKASGAIIWISNLLMPITDFLGFPNECVSLALIRPISGSGGLALYQNILHEVGPDTFAERVASVLMGSTETTFYTIAVYYGVTKIKKTKQTLVASLSADFAGFVFSALIVRLMFY
jgi:spore maturation protein B